MRADRTLVLAANYALWLIATHEVDWAVLRGGVMSMRQLAETFHA